MSSSLYKLPKPLQMRLKAALQPGEQVVWAGQPRLRAKWRELIGLSFFALFWNAITGTFVFLAAAAAVGLAPPDKMKGFATGWGPLIILAFMVPFLAIGLGLLWHIVRELRSGTRRVHAVTDRRLLTVDVGTMKPLDDRDRRSINFVRGTERRDGSGTLEIAVGVVRDQEGDPRPETLNWAGIPDVAFVRATLDQRPSATASATTRAHEQTAVPGALKHLPADVARAAERETRGERIAWVGQPDARRAALWSMLAWVIAVPWLWFTVRLQATAVGFLIDALGEGRSKTPLAIAVVMVVFALPFVWVGLQMLAAPLWVHRMAKATAYVITDRRLLTVRRRRGAIHASNIEPARIQSVSRTGSTERGHIGIVLGKTTDSDGDVKDLVETFWLVKDAARAEKLIEALRGEYEGGLTGRK